MVKLTCCLETSKHGLFNSQLLSATAFDAKGVDAGAIQALVPMVVIVFV